MGINISIQEIEIYLTNLSQVINKPKIIDDILKIFESNECNIKPIVNNADK